MKFRILKIFVLLIFCSCSKEFLEKKSDQKLLVPTSLSDFQLLLDNYNVMNKTAGLGMVASDDFYVTNQGYENGLSEVERSAYIWDLSSVNTLTNSDWDASYEQMFYSNIVLDGLEKFDQSVEVDQIKGSALFYRSYAYSNLLQIFAVPYRLGKDSSEPTIPFPMRSDINAIREKPTLVQGYQQIIDDLITAKELLPEKVSVQSRPSKNASKSLLARLHFLMGNFVEAESLLRELCSDDSVLLNYNLVDASLNRPFPSPYPVGSGNPEIIFYSPFITYRYLFPTNVEVHVQDELYKSYEENDLRKLLYFRDRGEEVFTFKGSYGGTQRGADLFAGLSHDENYLNYAESLIRNGKIAEGIDVLNQLLQTRFLDGTFEPYQVSSPNEALDLVLTERRKSLVGKGTRWFDIRRFNSDPEMFIDDQRIVGGTTHKLELNDERVKFEMPLNEQ